MLPNEALIALSTASVALFPDIFEIIVDSYSFTAFEVEMTSNFSLSRSADAFRAKPAS